MMPSAPMMTMSPTTKPKIGFSIDSIVGNRNNKNKSPIHFSQDSEGSEAPLSPLSDYSYQQKSPKFNTTHADIQRALRLSEYSQIELHNRYKRSLSTSPISGQTIDLMEQQKLIHHRISEQENHIQRNDMQKRSISPEMSPRTHLSVDDSNRRSQSPPSPISSPQQHVQKGPIMVPGIPANIMRPSPIGPPPHQMPQGYTPEMIATQNHFFRLGTFKLLPT